MGASLRPRGPHHQHHSLLVGSPARGDTPQLLATDYRTGGGRAVYLGGGGPSIPRGVPWPSKGRPGLPCWGLMDLWGWQQQQAQLGG